MWFKNYLSGRVHRVKAGDQYSDWGSMRAGIPQGSALGPLLFLIYVNSLPSQVTDGVLLQYADDTSLVCSGTSPLAAAEVMNQQLQLVYDWVVSNKMQLNFRKSKVMWFSASLKKPVPHPEIVANDTVLEVVDAQLYLGLMFDSKLSWERQVSNVCKKMSYYTYLLTCQRHILSGELKRLLVDSLVSSHLTYALCVWGPSLTQQQQQRLQRLQNRAIRFCTGTGKYESVRQYHHQLRWLPISELIEYQTLRQMYRQFHFKQSHCISLNPPIQFGHHHLHHTRSSTTVFAHPERFRLTKCQRFFRGRGTLWWNLLPAAVHVSARQPFSRTFYSTLYNNFFLI